MSSKDNHDALPLWRRQLEELLESDGDELLDSALDEECTITLGPILQRVYQMARMATLEAVLDDHVLGDEVDVGAARDFAEQSAMRFVGLVCMQLAAHHPSLVGLLLSGANEGLGESAHQIAERVAAELRSTFGRD